MGIVRIDCVHPDWHPGFVKKNSPPLPPLLLLPALTAGTLSAVLVTRSHFPLSFWAWLLLSLTCLCGPLSADTNRFSITTWTTDEGLLPQNSVLSLAQTRDGFLWMGTLSGLARFDGIRFKLFDESNIPELDSSLVIELFADSHDDLWIGMDSGALIRAGNDGTVSRISIDYPQPPTPAARVRDIAETSGGQIWFYSADGRLARYTNRRMEVTSPGPPSQVRTLAFDSSGLLWVGNDSSLTAFGPLQAQGTNLPAPIGVAPSRVDFLLSSRKGGFWRLINGGIQRCVGTHVERDLGSYPWSDTVFVSAACEDLHGNLVVGTYGRYGGRGEGVYWFSSDGEARHILPASSVMSLLVDREGSLWVGTDGGGLSRVKPKSFQTVPSSKGATVQTVTEAPDGAVWIGYNGSRIDLQNGRRVQTFTNILEAVGAQRAGNVRSLFLDKEQRLWVGLQTAALSGIPGLLQFRNGAFLPVPGFEVANQQVSALHEDQRGRMWVGTRGGAARWDGANWSTITTLDGLSNNGVTCIADDATGNVWLGTDSGLNRVAGEKISRYDRSNGLPSDRIVCLYVDRRNTLWVGTSAGLAHLKNDKFRVFTIKEGLAANNIGFILEDNHQCLWLGSRAGLMRVSLQALDNFEATGDSSLPIRIYGKEDGLPTRECTQGSQPAAWPGRSNLWFATIDGLVGVDPGTLQTNKVPPSVAIESVLVDGKPQRKETLRLIPFSPLVIPPQKQALEINFTVVSLTAPSQNRYRYRLGSQSVWTEGTGNSGSAHYAKLPAGDYTFEINACNEDNIWNPAGATLKFQVLPPFWRTWWFLTLCALGIIGIVAGTVHYISTQRLQRELATLKQQEALEQERARIARDLHDQLGANLTQVALLGEMAEADRELPQEVEEHARQICQTARETTRALDEIVWTVNPANDTADGLINYICKYAQDYLETAGLRYRLEAPPQLPSQPITPELRHNAFLVAKEAINNVVKHAHATSVTLRFSLDSDRLNLDIADDGRGIAAADQAKGRSGLKNMRKRMEDVGGTFSFSPGKDGGTIIRLSAPLSHDQSERS